MNKTVRLVEQLFGTSPYPVIVRNTDKDILFANASAQATFHRNCHRGKCYHFLHKLDAPPEACYCPLDQSRISILRIYEPSVKMAFERLYIPVQLGCDGACFIEIFQRMDLSAPGSGLVTERAVKAAGVLLDADEPDLDRQISLDMLTQKEAEVLRFIMEGKATTEIAGLMQISGNTVNFHMKNLFTKLAAKNRTHAAALAYKAQLESSLAIIRETHHRVKNNFLLLSSLIQLRRGSVSDPLALEALDWVNIRIRGFSAFHDLMAGRAGSSCIPSRDFFCMVIKSIMEIAEVRSRGIEVKYTIHDAQLNTRVAIACSQIINELVTNSILHAFGGYGGGLVEISFAPAGGNGADEESQIFALTVKDNGKGLDPDGSDLMSGSLGMRLLSRLVSQIDGTIEFRSGGGTEAVVLFRHEKPASGPSLGNV